LTLADGAVTNKLFDCRFISHGMNEFFLTNLISEGEVDAFLGDVNRPNFRVDDNFVGVGKPAHVRSNLKVYSGKDYGQTSLSTP